MANTPKEPKSKARTGRPSKYSVELAAEICGRLAAGESLASICRSAHMPGIVTVYRWMAAHEYFRQDYARAREDQADTHADEITMIADEMPPVDANGRTDSGWVQWQRTRIDARKWVAGKMKPKKYGDKVDVNHGSQPENPLTLLVSEISGQVLGPGRRGGKV